MHSLTRVLLGPQTPNRNIAEAIDSSKLSDGPLAVISAGWQEAESDIDDLREIVGRPLEDLRLYYRAEELLDADPRLATAYRERQDRLVEQQRLYRLRLKQLSVAGLKILGAEGNADMLAAEQRHAIAQLRALDRHHLHRTEAIHRPFDDAFNAKLSPLLAKHVSEISTIIDNCSAVLITGGNVAVLINRMRLFGVDELLSDRHIVAWSAGAMALAERVVLYHDRTPEGRRDPELFGAGCGLVPGFVFLPDAARRLREHEHLRIGLMCRRFSPDVCVALDNGTELRFEGSVISRATTVRQLNHDGRITKLRAA